MKGWVYIISNQAMPDLIKIGVSTKDPVLLASELNHTGSPHPYVVDYEVLIDHPRDIEQKVHRKLSGYREGREWFRCTPEFAISAIQQIAGGQAIVESFKRADRLKAEEIRRQQEKERQRQERVEAIWRDREMQIRSIRTTIAASISRGAISYSGIALSFLALVGLGLKLSDGVAVFWSLVLGVVVGFIGKGWHCDYQKSTDGYGTILKQRDEELPSVRSNIVISCPKYGQNLRVPRGANPMVKCPTCRTEFSHQD